GFTGDDGPTHHGAFDLAYLRCLPNLTVMAPADGKDFADMLGLAVREATGPVAVRFPRATVPQRGAAGASALEWGRAEVRRKGGDLALWGLGTGVEWALAAADILEREGGLAATVVNARFA